MTTFGDLFSSIDSEGEALEMIKAITRWFFVLAAITALLALFNPLTLIDAAIYAGVAYWLRVRHSRIAAFILVLLAGLLLLNAVSIGGLNLYGIILRSVMVLLALRALEATFRLRKYATATAPAGVAAGLPAATLPRPSKPPRPSAGLDAQDIEGLQALVQAGSDLSKPHKAEFYLLFPTEDAARNVVEKIAALGFATSVRPAAQGGEWEVQAVRLTVLTDEELKRARYLFTKLAKAGGGRYSGWEAAVER